jgi:hypothetical protein
MCQNYAADSFRLHLNDPLKFKSSPIHTPTLHFAPESINVKSYVLGELTRGNRIVRVQN